MVGDCIFDVFHCKFHLGFISDRKFLIYFKLVFEPRLCQCHLEVGQFIMINKYMIIRIALQLSFQNQQRELLAEYDQLRTSIN